VIGNAVSRGNPIDGGNPITKGLTYISGPQCWLRHGVAKEMGARYVAGRNWQNNYFIHVSPGYLEYAGF